MIELVFNLSLTQGEPPKQFSGLATRGAFLNLIRDANPPSQPFCTAATTPQKRSAPSSQ